MEERALDSSVSLVNQKLSEVRFKDIPPQVVATGISSFLTPFDKINCVLASKILLDRILSPSYDSDLTDDQLQRYKKLEQLRKEGENYENDRKEPDIWYDSLDRIFTYIYLLEQASPIVEVEEDSFDGDEETQGSLMDEESDVGSEDTEAPSLMEEGDSSSDEGVESWTIEDSFEDLVINNFYGYLTYCLNPKASVGRTQAIRMLGRYLSQDHSIVVSMYKVVAILFLEHLQDNGRQQKREVIGAFYKEASKNFLTSSNIRSLQNRYMEQKHLFQLTELALFKDYKIDDQKLVTLSCFHPDEDIRKEALVRLNDAVLNSFIAAPLDSLKFTLDFSIVRSNSANMINYINLIKDNPIYILEVIKDISRIGRKDSFSRTVMQIKNMYQSSDKILSNTAQKAIDVILSDPNSTLQSEIKLLLHDLNLTQKAE
jgi:hypothetical protein